MSSQTGACKEANHFPRGRGLLIQISLHEGKCIADVETCSHAIPVQDKWGLDMLSSSNQLRTSVLIGESGGSDV